MKDIFIEIDGSYGEGGGQILRTSVGLSVLTKKNIKIYNIRKNRASQGLKPQHLNGIKACAELCSGKLIGDHIGSQEIEFYPENVNKNNLNINIGTAGSISLILQSLMIAAISSHKKMEFSIIGGTSVKWSPPIRYLQNVALPILEKMNYKAKIKLLKEGYYPKGMGKVEMTIEPSKLKPLDMLEQGNIIEINGISHASEILRKKMVAERQKNTAERILLDEFKIKPKIDIKYENTASIGSGIDIWIKTDNTIIGSNFLGEPKKYAEKIGKEAAKMLIKQWNSGCALDKFMADQILPYLAILEKGKVSVSDVTNHCLTNMWAIEKFLPIKFSVNKNIIQVKKL